MKKLWFYFTGILACASGIIMLYLLVFGHTDDSFVFPLLVFCTLAVVTLMLDEKPDEKSDRKTLIQGTKLLVLIASVAITILFLSSCASTGYGCKGNQSWKQMVKRIN